MRVLKAAPQLLVRDVHVAGDLVEELLLGDLGPIVLLELKEEPVLFRERAGQEALVFGGVELSVGLEVGSLHQLWGRVIASRLENFVVRYCDTAALVLLAEEGVRQDRK